MSLFRKDPVQKFLNDRTRRRENLTFNSDCFGHCLLRATPSGFSVMIDSYSDQTGNYYFMPDGSIHIWSKESFDEFSSDEVTEWGFGLAGEYMEYLCFRLKIIPFTFVIQETIEGNALTWLTNRFPTCEKDTLNII
jgi:hypothetical protein